MSSKSTRNSRRSSPEASSTKGLPINFWKAQPLEQLAAEQGVRAIECLEEVLGQGANLWHDDAEFEDFLASLQAHRKTGA